MGRRPSSGIPGRNEKSGVGFAVTIDDRDLSVLYRKIMELPKELRPGVNGPIRDAALQCSERLAQELRQASAFGPPQAALVAQTVRPRRDRFPKVVIGGRTRVGHRRTVAGKLLWGSERGGHNFTRPSGGNYWIKPTVDRFQNSSAYDAFYSAVTQVFRQNGLL